MTPLHTRCFLLLTAILGLSAGIACAQGSEKAFEVAGAVVKPLPHNSFAHYYEVMLTQQVDHFGKAGEFSQRLYVGVRDLSAPVVMVTDGYGIDYASKPDYDHELAKLLEANLVVVEHRYFGRSQPSVRDYTWLTTRQAAEDVHAIRQRLGAQFSGKWITTGASKGGHASLAHRMAYPQDVQATVVYGTAVKAAATIKTGELLAPLMGSTCGRGVNQFQMALFSRHDSLFPRFLAQVAAAELEFGSMPVPLVWDYMRLEFPYSFWQTGQRCESMPDPNAAPERIVEYLCQVVAPKYYSVATRKRWEPAYYMFYHELGYYEYDLTPFQKWLSQTAYPNQYFAPQGMDLQLDKGYLQRVRDFLDAPAAHSVFFVEGDMDPWAMQNVARDNRFMVSGGSHRSKIADLPPSLQEELLHRLRLALAGN